jgi:hypothetical protein
MTVILDEGITEREVQSHEGDQRVISNNRTATDIVIGFSDGLELIRLFKDILDSRSGGIYESTISSKRLCRARKSPAVQSLSVSLLI